MKYDARNRAALENLAPNTRKAAYKWYQYCLDRGIEILITETIRDAKTQQANVAKGVSQTLRSYHLVGQALDFVPVNPDGSVNYNAYGRTDIKACIEYAKSLGFGWGGDWKTLIDKPHLEYKYKGYGTDKALDGEAAAPEQKGDDDDMVDIKVFIDGVVQPTGTGKLDTKTGRTYLQMKEFNGRTVHIDKWDNANKVLYVKTT